MPTHRGGGAPAARGAPAAAGGTPAAPAEEPPTEAERAIDEAIKKIAKLQSVSADARARRRDAQSEIQDHGTLPEGAQYAALLLLDRRRGLPDSTGTVPPGLRRRDALGIPSWSSTSRIYRKLSIKPILERLNSPDLDPEIKTKAITQMGLAGPETLLVGLRKTIRFDQKEEAVLDGRKVWKFHGTWKSRQGLAFDSRPVNPHRRPCRRTSRWTPSCTWARTTAGPTSWILEGREADRPGGHSAGRARTGKIIGSKSSIEKDPPHQDHADLFRTSS